MSASALRPAPLHRSIPFWILLAGSAVTAGAGAFVLTDTLSRMSAVLLDGTATGVDVYVGQVWAILGAILIGAGALGLALTAAVAIVRGLLVSRTGDAGTESAAEPTDAFGYDRELGYDGAEADESADVSVVGAADERAEGERLASH